MEAGILYTAVFETESTVHFAPELLGRCENRLAGYAENAGGLSGIVKVWETENTGLTLYYDMSREHLMVAMEETPARDRTE